MSEPPGQDAAETPNDPHRLPAKAGRTLDASDTDVEEMLRRRVPVRLRVAQAVALLIVIAVGAGLVVHSLPGAPGRSQAGTATPPPDPQGPILLLSNVSTGTVTLNGAPLTGSPPLSVTFRRGLNTITLTAPPFRPRTCHVQWPGRQNDGGCDFPPAGGWLHASVGGRPVVPMLVVVLPFDLEDLPSVAQTQALANITDALQSAPPRTRVPAGEYIATGQDASGGIVSQRTDAPVQAALLVTATSFGYLPYPPPDLFCADPGCSSAGDAPTGQRGTLPEWVGLAEVTVRWQFSSSAGLVARSAPLPTEQPMPLLLTYDAQQGWTLDQAATQHLAGLELPAALARTVCSAVKTVLNPVAQQQGAIFLTPLHDNGLQGCELGLQTPQGANAGRFVWRFGVLLAADGPAHALLPALPVAPASELAAVGA